MSDSDTPVSPKAAKHKKSKKREKIDDPVDELPSKRLRTSSNTSDTGNIDDYWNEEEIEQLLDTVTQHIPRGDKTYRIVLPLLDWQNIRVGLHSPESCRKKFEFIMSKVRKERSIFELANAAKAINNNGRLLEYPEDMPRRPLPGVFNFFTERLRKLKSKHPDWPFPKIKQQAKDDFKKLSAKKKAKLKAKYEQEVVEYHKALAEWQEKHPEFASRIRSFKQAPALTSPLLLYVNSKCSKDMNEDPTLSKAELKAKYQQKWKTLKDKKKYRYINKAVKAKIQYDRDVEEYIKSNPDYKPPRCRTGFLTNDEWKIKEKFDGKPEPPPRNGFSLFAADNSDENLEQTELTRRWKDLPDTERDLYNKRARKAKEEYPDVIRAFLDKFDEDERKIYEEHLQLTQRKNTSTDLFKDSDKVPAGATSDGQKVKQANKIVQDFPGAPQKPPSSGYQLFCSLLLRKTKDIPNKERMGFCAQEWKKADQEKYKRMCKKQNKKYRKAVEEYISKLPEDAAAQFLLSKSNKSQKISVLHLLKLDQRRSEHLAASRTTRSQTNTPPSPGGESSSSAFVDIESPAGQKSLPETGVKHVNTTTISSSSLESDNDDYDVVDEEDSSNVHTSLRNPKQKLNGLEKKTSKNTQQNNNNVRITLKKKRTLSNSTSTDNEQVTNGDKKGQKSPHKMTLISYESFSE